MTSVFDLHDMAYYVWRDAGVRGAVLVHLDAHHDMEPETRQGGIPINIGNFIRAALRDGLLSAVFWVVPEPMWTDTRTRRWLTKELRFAGALPIHAADSFWETAIEGAPVWVGPLDALPPFASPVLIDVDVDYLMTTARHSRAPAWPAAVPWCWPEDLVTRLAARAVPPGIVTIATSVTGGFTPLRWQHLGRELALRLDAVPDGHRLEAFGALRRAAEHRQRNDLRGALGACEEALGRCEREAAVHFHHAETLLAIGERDRARAAYERARSLDPSYRHPFRTPGPTFLRRNRVREALDAFETAFELDPDDPYAQLGVAMAMARQGRAREAAGLAARSLATVDSVDGWRTVAAARAAAGDAAAAIAAYHRAMSLSLAGAIPLDGPWAANPERRFGDSSHWRDHVGVGDLLARGGDLDAAIAHYRIASAAAPWARRVRLRLALLEARRLVAL